MTETPHDPDHDHGDEPADKNATSTGTAAEGMSADDADAARAADEAAREGSRAAESQATPVAGADPEPSHVDAPPADVDQPLSNPSSAGIGPGDDTDSAPPDRTG